MYRRRCLRFADDARIDELARNRFVVSREGRQPRVNASRSCQLVFSVGC